MGKKKAKIISYLSKEKAKEILINAMGNEEFKVELCNYKTDIVGKTKVGLYLETNDNGFVNAYVLNKIGRILADVSAINIIRGLSIKDLFIWSDLIKKVINKEAKDCSTCRYDDGSLYECDDCISNNKYKPKELDIEEEAFDFINAVKAESRRYNNGKGIDFFVVVAGGFTGYSRYSKYMGCEIVRKAKKSFKIKKGKFKKAIKVEPKMDVIDCPECEAQVPVNEGQQQAYCLGCGSTIDLIDDSILELEIDYCDLGNEELKVECIKRGIKFVNVKYANINKNKQKEYLISLLKEHDKGVI